MLIAYVYLSISASVTVLVLAFAAGRYRVKRGRESAAGEESRKRAA